MSEYSPEVYERALDFHFANRVKSIQFNVQRRVFTAVVADKTEYHVSAVFDAKGELYASRCGCFSVPFHNITLCEHVATLLLFVEEKDREGYFDELGDREKARRMFALFSEPERGGAGFIGDFGGAGGADSLSGFSGPGGTDSADGTDAAGNLGNPDNPYNRYNRDNPGNPGGAFPRDEVWLTAFITRDSLYNTGYRYNRVPVSHTERPKIHFNLNFGKRLAEKPVGSYIVKDLRGFIKGLIRNDDIRFSKKFTFSPSVHRFDGFDLEILNLILDLHEQLYGDDQEYGTKFARGVNQRHGTLKLYDERYLVLSERYLRKFIGIFSSHKRDIMVDLDGTKDYIRAEVVDTPVPIVFHLKRSGSDIVLDSDLSDDTLPLTSSADMVFDGAKIYRVQAAQRDTLSSLIRLMSEFGGSKEIVFKPSEHEKFVNGVLSVLKRAGTLIVDDDVNDYIIQRPLEASVYLDRNDDGVSADVRFSYGETEINPFAAVRRSHDAEAQRRQDAETENIPFINPIIVHDTRRENALMDILADADFKVNNGKIYLDGDDSIFFFVADILPKLQQYAEVYYSEDFKKMTIRRGIGFRVKLSFSGSAGGGLDELLSVGFDTDYISREELIEIIKSIRERKRYYKLRDGALLNLSENEVTEAHRLLDLIGAGEGDIKSGQVTLPAYRALYLDYYLRNSQLKGIGRDRIFRDFVRSISEPFDTEYSAPQSVDYVLRDYQRTGFKWLRVLSEYRLGGVLADDMGLGKTLQVLVLLLSEKEAAARKTVAESVRKEAGDAAKEEAGDAAKEEASAALSALPAIPATLPTLIVAPTSLIYNWCAEIEKFTPGLSYIAVSGGKQERDRMISKVSDYDIVITSYPLIRRDYEAYKGIAFKYIILDEAQYIKNPNSQNAVSVKCLHARSRFALTGTPMENRLSDLWSIFDFVMPGYLGSAKKFNERYQNGKAAEERDGALGDLSAQIKPFTLRRLKKDVLRELPEKIDTKMYAEMTKEQKKLYTAYLEKIRSEIASKISEQGFEKSQIAIFAALTRLRQLCCHPALFVEGYKDDSGKFLLLQEIISDALDGGHRILLFSQFTSMLSIIREWADGEGIRYHYLDGSTKSFDRHRMINVFNQGDGAMFLLSLKAGGTGVNLTGADTVIHYDPWWNPAVEDQAADRAYRIGQMNTVQVIKLLTAGTIEERINEMQERKKRLIDAVIHPGETFLTKLSKEDLEYILN